MRTARAIFASVAAIFALSSCAPQPMSIAQLETDGEYVALGSSFASGPGIGDLQEGAPARCARSTDNYASLLAQRLHLRLIDQSCSGAATAHILGDWNELPAQIDAVTKSTKLITLTVGGNDVNYVGNLFVSGCKPGESVKNGKYNFTCTPPKIPTDGDYQTLETALDTIARELRARAPKAKIVFIQYASLVPDVLCEATPMAQSFAEMSRKIGARLAETTARIARKNHVALVPFDKLSQDHTACSSRPWSNGAAMPAAPADGIPWHPNAAGHRAIADELAAMLGATSPR